MLVSQTKPSHSFDWHEVLSHFSTTHFLTWGTRKLDKNIKCLAYMCKIILQAHIRPTSSMKIMFKINLCSLTWKSAKLCYWALGGFHRSCLWFNDCSALNMTEHFRGHVIVITWQHSYCQHIVLLSFMHLWGRYKHRP